VTSPIIKSRLAFIREGIFAMKISALSQQLDHEKKGGNQRRRLSLTFTLRYTVFPITAS